MAAFESWQGSCLLQQLTRVPLEPDEGPVECWPSVAFVWPAKCNDTRPAGPCTPGERKCTFPLPSAVQLDLPICNCPFPLLHRSALPLQLVFHFAFRLTVVCLCLHSLSADSMFDTICRWVS